jgi:hypothetical protein
MVSQLEIMEWIPAEMPKLIGQGICERSPGLETHDRHLAADRERPATPTPTVTSVGRR